MRSLLFTAACHTLLAAAAAALHAAPPTALLENATGWQVTFEPETAVLECRHAGTGTTLKGRLAFSAARDGKRFVGSVQASRDTAATRLALVDNRNDAQGYLVVTGDATRVTLSIMHRPPQDYAGELRYTPEIEFSAQAFACRTLVNSANPVIQMASGPADSTLNDSLFDAQRDLLLRLGGAERRITTVPGANATLRFRAELAAALPKPESASITIELLPHYYESRYVPNYHALDRQRCPRAPTGWMAWNIYFDLATEGDNLAEARVGAKHLKPFGLEFWSIESWQEHSERPVSEVPVSEFHSLTMRPSPSKFPHGMKWLADQVRALGFRPGIWTVSFGTGDEAFYKAHRDWFLHDAQGRPMRNWSGRYVLDPTLPDVLKFTEDTHRQMAVDWGYEFFKCDGMSGGGPHLSAHFFERPDVRAAFRHPDERPYAAWIESLRRGIGPKCIFLACQGHYTGAEVGLVDAARIGGDIVHCGDPPPWRGRQGYLRQAQATQSQLFVNNIVWYNDPDTLLVGDFAPLDVARVATTVVALPGQLTFFGDKLTQLAPERMRLLQQTLPVCDVRPLDLVPRSGELLPIWDLKISRPFAQWDVVSLFNWPDEPRTQRLSFAEIGLDATRPYLVYDFWNQKFLGVLREQVECSLAPRSNRLLAIHPALDRPQFVSTDRHISQGGVELCAASWNAERLELACTFRLVANDRLTASFYVPPSFALVGATADGATVERTATPPMVSIALRSPQAGEAQVRLTFRRTAQPKP